jgi:hypothetical protein
MITDTPEPGPTLDAHPTTTATWGHMPVLVRFIALIVTLGYGCTHAPRAPDPTTPEHLRQARSLLDHLELQNTSYRHGSPRVGFEGEVESHTDCSGFIQSLLERSYGYTDEDLSRWLGSPRPLARHFHDAIEARRGFTPLEQISEIEPGDLIAIRYSVKKRGNSGHVLLASGKASALPEPGAWSLPVIDSSHSGHGPTDTRHARGKNGKDHDGLGEGILRIYADPAGKVRGYSWSTNANSRFKPPEAEHLVMGRLILGFKPDPK